MRPELSPRTKRILEEAKPKKVGSLGLIETAFRKTIYQLSINVTEAARMDVHPDFATEIGQAAKDGLVLAFVGGPHTAWFDAFMIARAAQTGVELANQQLSAEAQIRGTAMLFAKTMQTEKQGSFLNTMFQATLPILTRYGTYPVYTATENDQTKRHEDPNSDQFMADMLAFMHDGYASVSTLGEGSVQAGRLNEQGNRTGMQLLNEKTSGMGYALARKLRRSGIAYVPVTTEGGWKVNDPSKRIPFPTLEGLMGGIFSLPVCSIYVGKPIRSDNPEITAQIKDRDWEGITDRIGLEIAAKTSLDMRGVYINTETLQAARMAAREKALRGVTNGHSRT